MIVTVAGFLFDSKIDWIIGTEWLIADFITVISANI